MAVLVHFQCNWTSRCFILSSLTVRNPQLPRRRLHQRVHGRLSSPSCPRSRLEWTGSAPAPASEESGTWTLLRLRHPETPTAPLKGRLQGGAAAPQGGYGAAEQRPPPRRKRATGSPSGPGQAGTGLKPTEQLLPQHRGGTVSHAPINEAATEDRSHSLCSPWERPLCRPSSPAPTTPRYKLTHVGGPGETWGKQGCVPRSDDRRMTKTPPRPSNALRTSRLAPCPPQRLDRILDTAHLPTGDPPAHSPLRCPQERVHTSAGP